MNAWGDHARSNPAATTLTDLFTVPAATYLVGIVRVANRGSQTTYRIAVAPAGAADNVDQYSVYDEEIDVKGRREVVIAAGPGDVIRVYAAGATLTFTLFGVIKT